MLVSCLAHSANPKMKRHISPKRQLIFSLLDSVISQKIELFYQIVRMPEDSTLR
jgi:hypothetical protein